MEDISSDTSSDGESNPDDEPVLRRSSRLASLNVNVQPTFAVEQDAIGTKRKACKGKKGATSGKKSKIEDPEVITITAGVVEPNGPKEPQQKKGGSRIINKRARTQCGSSNENEMQKGTRLLRKAERTEIIKSIKSLETNHITKEVTVRLQREAYGNCCCISC